MDQAQVSLHTHTPAFVVLDARAQPVAAVRCLRVRGRHIPQLLRERTVLDVAGRAIQRQDARLRHANTRSVHSLSGQALATESVDAGWKISLFGAAGQAVAEWNARCERRFDRDSSLRPVAVFEEATDEEERCVERYVYGDAGMGVANRCGRLVWQEDAAGVLTNEHFSMTGQLLSQTRGFAGGVAGAPSPEAVNRNRHGSQPLAAPTKSHASSWRYGALGDVLEQVDAAGHVRQFALTMDGQPRRFTAMSQVLVCDTSYDAQGRVAKETLGNGVTVSITYDPANGRMTRLHSARADGSVLQDLNYDYDPVGNPVRIEDRAQATHHFANQRVEPVRAFAYDTLYQLVEATGHEAAANGKDVANYSETYEYDASGNMLRQAHVGAQNFTRRWRVDEHSNRSLPAENRKDFDTAFDANGNLRQLQPGQTLHWDLRNQLAEVHPVQRDDGTDDYERYRYDASGQRLRKMRLSKARTVEHVEDVLYLPGLEIRHNTATGETLHMVLVSTGRSHVRILHWEQGRPDGLANDQPRYALTDHLGSTVLELNSDAKSISQEIYYPYGGTAYSAAKGAVEAKYRFVRYSGKERDATGLYYYGLRYYAPWSCRWINPDPAGEVDGLNLYGFLGGSPLRYRDDIGGAAYDVLSYHETIVASEDNLFFDERGMSNLIDDDRKKTETGLALAIDFLEQAVGAFENGRVGSGFRKSFKATFGNLSGSLRRQVIDELHVEYGLQLAYLRRIQTTDQWRLILFEAEYTNGLTYDLTATDEYGGRGAYMLGLSKKLLRNRHAIEVAGVLIHEASHGREVGRLGTGKQDFFYNRQATLGRASGLDRIAERSESARHFLRSVVRKGPEGAGAWSVSAAYDAHMQALTNSDSPASRNQFFVNDDRVRAGTLLMNADTYSSLVIGSKLPLASARTAYGQTSAASGSWLRRIASSLRWPRVFHA